MVPDAFIVNADKDSVYMYLKLCVTISHTRWMPMATKSEKNQNQNSSKNIYYLKVQFPPIYP